MNDEQNKATPPEKPLRILLVEDHHETRETLSNLLTYLGHDVSAARSQRDAQEILRAKSFDVLLSDLALPDGSGYEVMAQARHTQTLTGVALTGFCSDEDIALGKQAGFDFHLR